MGFPSDSDEKCIIKQCETRTVELKPGGSDISVTFDTRREYVDLYCRWQLEGASARQFQLLAQGFEKVVDSALWSFLTAEEAGEQEMSCFRECKIDSYDASDPYIEDFWSVLQSFDTARLKKFLAFTTGTNRAPLNGLRDVRLVVQKHGVEPTTRLPTAQTCFNLLLLPRYESRDKMEQLLCLAIENSEGFGLQ
ncbi:E3 ubiquitin-protein ligase HUWE1 [Symbiodinium microadriaticum]|uniref:HECT-type E3 ubiquitin transferase n=1 Tax=Symbiodinium microadriaticum TaxID=2951 RepID=A0A1Q9F2T6_SYMMI|nr:E3 ubiquitin-protein ligase HUWE1 [Symbiodinium microadriaticum]